MIRRPITADVAAVLNRRPNFSALLPFTGLAPVPFQLIAAQGPGGIVIWWRVYVGWSTAEWITLATRWN